MRCLIIAITLFFVGCASTPNRDDYAKHVNKVGGTFYNEDSFAFSFAENDNVELRGIHVRDDTAAESPILYQGGAGLIGLFAQIGAHAAIVNSSRNSMLSQAQEQANNQVQPLIEMVDGVSISSLVEQYRTNIVATDSITADTLMVKPIFLSNTEMNQLALKLVVWLPDENGGEKHLRYQNMIQIFGPKLTSEERDLMLQGDNSDIVNALSELLNTALHVVKKDLTGEYSEIDNPDQTFFIKQNNKIKVVRGSLVDEKCGFQIVQDLHSWYIGYPPEQINTPIKFDPISQC
ncbi:hypothetical protein [Aliiglaciecola sp. LCG003]|uniref:hypothetical protein n=1 Tax=Aliiglaciecola sp. LCG003 TaxID=3053655 RepID=UPI0025747C56|nr:hypothetical protein [Aliiglaciecola sp. LCG003]WJG08158.1 hypothetical protein QR722_12495 [Aliiglaciecola sp. LCG003]